MWAIKVNRRERRGFKPAFSGNTADVEIVSGGARGIDRFAELYAEAKNYPISIFAADWDRFGESAGMIRNEALVKYAEKFIIFHDGKSRGTQGTLSLVKKANKPFRLFSFEV